jgi:hypothetical protein
LAHRLWDYCKSVLPVYAAFGMADRLYQYHRFGSFFTTYIQVRTLEERTRNPALPPAYPFETPFHVGFLGPLISPEKSIFLFDPLLILTIVLGPLLWRRLRPESRAYLASSSLLLLAYICFYARYTVWSGDEAWGDRYVSTAAQMVALLSVPLWHRHRAELPKLLSKAAVALVIVSVAVQLASVAFWCPLEIYQMNTPGRPRCVVALRFENIAAFALGKRDQWGLTNDSMKAAPWAYVHMDTFNFLPFVLRRAGEAPGWVVRVLTVLWLVLLGMLIAVLLLLQKTQTHTNRESGFF